MRLANWLSQILRAPSNRSARRRRRRSVQHSSPIPSLETRALLAAGTPELATQITPGATGSVIQEMVAVGGKVYMLADQTAGDRQLWVYDPVANSTTKLSNFAPSASNLDAQRLTVVGTDIYFAADHTNGFEAWRYNTVTGTLSELGDINPTTPNGSGGGQSNPIGWTAFNGLVYFSASSGPRSSGGHGGQLWSYNPTNGALAEVTNLNAGYGDGASVGSTMVPVGGKLFFTAYNGTYNLGFGPLIGDNELWSYDPSNGNFVEFELNDTDTGISSNPMTSTRNYAVLDNKLYFTATAPGSDSKLYVVDPATGAQPTIAMELSSGTAADSISQMMTYNGKIYMRARDRDAPDTGGELVSYDPATGTGTVLTNINPTVGGSSNPTDIVQLGGNLYFFANDNAGGTANPELWEFNLTTNTARVLSSFSSTDTPAALRVIGTRLAFSANDGTSGWEVWSYDPATDVVSRTADLNAGSGNGYQQFPNLAVTVVGQYLYFAGDNGATGQELFRVRIADAPAPVITSSTTISNVVENSAASTLLYTATADVAVTWSLSGTDAGLLTINSSGEVRLNAPANYEAKTSYNFTIVATDSNSQTDTLALVLNVTNVNDVAPALTLSSPVTTLPENTDLSAGMKVADVSVSDPDGGTLTYSLTGSDAALFELRNGNTELWIKNNTVLNYETPALQSLDVTVNVHDAALAGDPDDFESISISVTDVNDVAPTLTLTQTVTRLPEGTNLASGLKVADFVISDADGGTNTVSLSGADASLFEVRNGTELWLVAGQTLSIATNHKLDVTVEVDDAAISGSPDDAADVSIEIIYRADIVGWDKTTGDWHVQTSNGTTLTDSVYAHWNPSLALVDLLTGDFNGDGLVDVAGRVSTTGNWYVGLNDGDSFNTTYWGNWSTGFTWEHVQVGDFNGDGADDIAGYVESERRWLVAVASGPQFETSVWRQLSTNVLDTFGNFAVGDFTGDGADDILVRNTSTARPNSGKVAVLVSNGTTFSTANSWGTWSTAFNWGEALVGDYNNDGLLDAASYIASTRVWSVAISSGTSFSTTAWRTMEPGNTYGQFVAGDFNQDGRSDILVRNLGNGDVGVLLSSGTGFSGPKWGVWNTAFTWSDLRVGDYDGDGRDDVATRVASTGEWFVARSTGSSFTTSAWGLWPTSGQWFGIGAGEANRV